MFVHQKVTDAAGHTKDPRIKQATIERLDAAFAQVRARRVSRAPTATRRQLEPLD